MKYCPTSTGHFNKPTASFCSICGVELKVRVAKCTKCGTESTSKGGYCSSCGSDKFDIEYDMTVSDLAKAKVKIK